MHERQKSVIDNKKMPRCAIGDACLFPDLPLESRHCCAICKNQLHGPCDIFNGDDSSITYHNHYRQAGCLGVSVPRLHTLQLEAGITDDVANVNNIAVILQNLQSAANTLCQRQKQHVELRTTYLEGLVEAIVLDSSPDLEHDSVAMSETSVSLTKLSNCISVRIFDGCFARLNVF